MDGVHRHQHGGEPGGIKRRVRADRPYAAELEASIRLGWPRSLFVGARGWPAPSEPLFTEVDTEEVLAWLEVEAENCPGCGHPKAETFDPANEDAYVGTVLACAACTARRKAEKGLDDLDGVYSFATKRPGGDR